MAFEITSDTVVKILVRRGLEVERLDTLLSEGELGYSVDTRRLFIGDGYNLGGNPVSNLNFGNVLNIQSYLPYATRGDTIKSNNLNYILGTDQTQQDAWVVDMPGVYTDGVSIGGTFYYYNILEYAPDPDNRLRIRAGSLGDGFTIDYLFDGTGSIASTIQNVYSTLNFDARFISLCAFRSINIPNDSYRIGSLYFGDIFTKTIKNNLSATVNVEKNLSINDHTLSAYQLQMYARDLNVNGSLIDATSGSLYIRSKGPIYLGTDSAGGSGLSISDTNVTVFGNLSVLGDLAYLNSVVSVTSALSVVNNGTGPAFVVRQNGTQPIATFFDDTQSALRIMDGAKIQFFEQNSPGGIGINTTNTSNALTINGSISSNGSLTIDGNISAGGNLIINGNTTLGDNNLDTLTLNGTNVSIPNNLNFDSNTLLIDATNNRVGIGTDTPEQTLHVLKGTAGSMTADTGSIAVFEGSGNNHISILTPNAQTGGLVFGSPSDNFGSYLSWNHDNNELKLATDKTGGFISLLTDDEAPVVRITSSGNVGIGTTAPATKLEVNGSLRVGRGNDLQFNSALKWTGTGSVDSSSYMSGIANSVEQIRIDTNGVKISDSKTLTLGVGTNIALDTGTGTIIGTTASQKLGFYGITPKIQPSSANQAAVAAYVGGANGYSTTTQAQAIITLVNEIRTTLVNLGLMKGSA